MTAALERIEAIAEHHCGEWGESARFRGVHVPVVINSAPTVKWANGQPMGKNPIFLPEDYSTIRVLRSTIREMPTVGESFIDEDGQSHRIQKIQAFRLSYLCLCRDSGPALPPVG